MANRMDPRALARRSLDRKLAPFRAGDLARPPKGWVRAVRDALGMTTRDLAARLGVSQPSIVALEKSEAQDSVTLGTLRNAAEAMGCRLVYALVPDQSLEDTLRNRAGVVVDQNMKRVSHSMRLEDQGLGDDDLAAERDRLIDEMLRGNLSRLWSAR
jgi:predicted DNA-binding mobile mystery protein A